MSLKMMRLEILIKRKIYIFYNHNILLMEYSIIRLLKKKFMVSLGLK